MSPPLMKLPGYEVPQNALMNFAPINNAIDSYEQRQERDRQYGIQKEQLGMQRERFGMEKKRFDAEQTRRTVEQIAGIAQAADRETDPVRRAMIFKRALEMHPGYRTGEIDKSYLDPINGPKLLMAEAAKYADPATRAKTEAEIDQTRAHADYFRAGAANLRARAGAAAGAPAAPSAPAPDPLAGYGLDEDGNVVMPRSAVPSPGENWQWPGADGAAPSFGSPMPRPARPPGLMRLGGPAEQTQQQQQPPPDGADARPALMAQALERPFGPAGVRSPQVPGIVTAPRSGSTDPTATRAAEAQRAYEAATPEQQARLRTFRQHQAIGAALHGRPPRAGYYYGPDGMELPMADRNTVSERQARVTAQNGIDSLDEAETLLKSKYFPGENSLQMLLGIWNGGRGIGAAKAGVMDLAFSLSGKSVSNAERQEFMDIYMPKWSDGSETQAWKIGMMRKYFDRIKNSQKAVASDDRAAEVFREFLREGAKGPTGETGARNSVQGLSNEELLRRLNE